MLVDETNDTESKGVENCFKVGPPKFTFRLPASGCRFGSGPGRSWGSVSVSLVLFFSVGSNHGRSLGTDAKTSSDPKITC